MRGATEALLETITIDCAGVTSTGEFWQRYIEATNPDGAEIFGRNLDALWDAIQGGGPGWPGNVRLVFANADALAPLRTGDGSEFLPSLKRLAAEATEITVQIV